jgi:hypothetical protein
MDQTALIASMCWQVTTLAPAFSIRSRSPCTKKKKSDEDARPFLSLTPTWATTETSLQVGLMITGHGFSNPLIPLVAE